MVNSISTCYILFNKYILASTLPDTIICTGHTAVNKTDEMPALMQLTLQKREGRQKISVQSGQKRLTLVSSQNTEFTLVLLSVYYLLVLPLQTYVISVDQKFCGGNENAMGRWLFDAGGMARPGSCPPRTGSSPCALTQAFSQLVKFTTLLSAPGPLHTPSVWNTCPSLPHLVTPPF